MAVPQTKTGTGVTYGGQGMKMDVNKAKQREDVSSVAN